MVSTPATDLSVEDAGRAVVDPSAYADGRLDAACRVLRHHDPVHRVDVDGFRPFHAVTRHEDVHTVERLGQTFHAGPRYRLHRRATEEAPGGLTVRSLVRMDAPDHTAYRALAAEWFVPKNLRTLEDVVAGLARRAVDEMAARDDGYDFVSQISMILPLRLICWMLGIPEADGNLFMRLAQVGFGAEDPEYLAEAMAAFGDEPMPAFADYIAALVADRRARPTDDLSSTLANARLHGEHLPDLELMSYFAIVATAGHDTTSAVTAGGLQALMEHPDQLERLQRDPALLNLAVEEMIRWVTPVKSFMRTATTDTVLGGTTVGRGEAVLVLYPSANRDEAVFADPYRFDVGREPNRHLAFGYGAHFCLGAQLARMELRAFFHELLPRLRSIEPAGEPALIKTLFVGGHKRLPVRAHVV